MSRRTLSELCGLSKNMIAVYERGEADPSAATLCLLADHFGVSTDYLLGRTNSFARAQSFGHLATGVRNAQPEHLQAGGEA